MCCWEQWITWWCQLAWTRRDMGLSAVMHNIYVLSWVATTSWGSVCAHMRSDCGRQQYPSYIFIYELYTLSIFPLCGSILKPTCYHCGTAHNVGMPYHIVDLLLGSWHPMVPTEHPAMEIRLMTDPPDLQSHCFELPAPLHNKSTFAVQESVCFSLCDVMWEALQISGYERMYVIGGYMLGFEQTFVVL